MTHETLAIRLGAPDSLPSDRHLNLVETRGFHTAVVFKNHVPRVSRSLGD